LHLWDQLLKEGEDAWLKKVAKVFYDDISSFSTNFGSLKTFHYGKMIVVISESSDDTIITSKEQCKLDEVARDQIEHRVEASSQRCQASFSFFVVTKVHEKVKV
jgi:hypothetical protein